MTSTMTDHRTDVPSTSKSNNDEEDSNESATETVYSLQAYETEFVIDTPDTDTKSEFEYNYSDLVSQDGFDIEYDVMSLSEVEEDKVPIGVDSSSVDEDIVVIATTPVTTISHEQPLSSLKEDDSDNNSIQDTVRGPKYQFCLQCKLANDNSLFRYCKKCFRVRKAFFPPRPKKRKKRNRSPENCLIGEITVDITKENITNEAETDSFLQDTLSKPSLCVMCKKGPKDTIFLHGSVAHMCCCYKCAMKCWKITKKCPKCNKRASSMVKAYVL